MQLKLTTDYAIRTIVYLATQSGITSVAEIGSKMGISENYFQKTGRNFSVGYCRSNGGYYKNQQMSGDRRILQPAWHTILHDQKILSGTAGSDGRIFIRYYD